MTYHQHARETLRGALGCAGLLHGDDSVGEV